ncbi:MAG TPA: glycoside hydrolase family 2, partial [Bacteroidales bacterium]|nr:glycoside hydrolase family 2 [Bacteroidales bacterium]
DRPVLKADGYDLAFVTVDVLDEQGVPVPDADNLITFSLEGPATIKAVDNGSPISHESFVAHERKAFHGKCLVVVQAGRQEGTITLTARSEAFAEEYTLSLKTRFVQ